ncbi:MAG: hypothetical protein QNJ78_09395 [Gammaproteobacteria bacterium]|nr:hypothetical protein [Gammaproteobacteria bacterium]
MILDLPIYAFGGFSQRVTDQLPTLKPQLDKIGWRPPRRSDRLTQLGLLGLSACAGTDKLPKDTPLLLASGEANLSSTILVNEQLYRHASIPSPISFINSVNNSTAFYLNQTLGISGRSLSVSRDECSLEAAMQIAGLWQHEVSLPILVGTVDEVPVEPGQHKRRMGYPAETILGEGSFWFLCGQGGSAAVPIATIRYCGTLESAEATRDFMQSQDVSHFILTAGIDRQRLPLDSLPGSPLEPASPGRFSTQNAYYLAQGLESLTRGDRLCLINGKRRSSRFSLAVIDKH